MKIGMLQVGSMNGGYRFQKHIFRAIGELKDTGEEFECAVVIDQMPEVKAWVRNIERRPDSSFWLQTASDRFYPDFVAQLNDGRILVVEYKGADRWTNDDSKEKRAVGELWAERSNGRCILGTPKGKDWQAIEDAIKKFSTTSEMRPKKKDFSLEHLECGVGPRQPAENSEKDTK